MKVTTKPTVRFTQKAYQQMFALTDACPIEISAMGVLATDEQRKEWGIDEEFYVLDFHVPDQECTGGSTVMETDSYADLSLELRDQGIKPEQVCVWWHSHVNMGVGHSGTDERQIEDFGFDEVCISIITNKRRDINVRVDIFSPVRYSFEGCSYAVDQVSILDDGWAKEMVDNHVTKPAPIRMNVTKKSKKTATSKNYYGSYVGNLSGVNGHWSNWSGDDDYIGWNAKDDDEKEEEAEVLVEEEESIDLCLPQELEELQELFDDKILNFSEVLDYHAKWYAKELSIDEINDELSQLYYESKWGPGHVEEEEDIQEVLAAEFEEEDDEPVGVAV